MCEGEICGRETHTLHHAQSSNRTDPTAPSPITEKGELWAAMTAGTFYVMRFAEGVLDEIVEP